MPRALLTGAGGFIARHLALRLAAAGWDVAGVDLRADPEAGIAEGDVTRPGAWQALAEGCDAVVHTAAIVSLDGDWPAFAAVNVDGCRHALDAARLAGARFVHLSSVTVAGNDFPDGADEDRPVRPTGSPYVDTKIASEHVVLRAVTDGADAVIVRPGDVFGPGSRPWTTEPIRLMRARMLVLPDGGRGIHSPVYVDDLCDGILAAATAERARGGTFTLSGGVGVPVADYFGAYADALGLPAPRTAPAAVVRALAGFASGVATLAGRRTELNAHSIAYLRRRGTHSIARAREVLDWGPAVGYEEGMRRTIDWARAQGLGAGGPRGRGPDATR